MPMQSSKIQYIICETIFGIIWAMKSVGDVLVIIIFTPVEFYLNHQQYINIILFCLILILFGHRIYNATYTFGLYLYSLYNLADAGAKLLFWGGLLGAPLAYVVRRLLER